MHTRRLAALLLGLWLGGSLFMTAVATGNFASVDRLLAAPSHEAADLIAVLGKDNTRMLLRHQAGEMNRYYFENWEWVQIALGVALIATLYFALRASRWALGFAAVMLALVLFARIWVTPQMIWLGRSIDFIAKAAPSPARTEFWGLHKVYAAMETLKILIAVGLSIYLVSFRTKRKLKAVAP